MDPSASPLSSKTQKLFQGQDANQYKDVISRLPEDILVRILSFLSTKEAIKTSVLSKRWRYLWVCIPDFTFPDSSLYWSITKSYDQVLELGASFLDSIDKALLRRNDLCLGNCHLWLRMHVGASRLHSWVSAAVRHKVQKLTLSLPDEGDFVLPDSLFTSESLSYFWLRMQCCALKVPSFICFSGLKLLNLGAVVFQDNHSAQQLFSSCPILEDLSLYSCHWENIKEITIEIPTLRSLTFSDSLFSPDHYLSGKIMIFALTLETLNVSSSLIVELLPCNLPSLKSATIDIYNWNGGQEHSRRIVKLLSGIHNVNSLHLSSETLEPLLFAENIEGRLPTFYNLTSLYNFKECPLIRDDYACGGLVSILQKSPNLETLYLPRGFKPQEQDMMLETVPHCFQSCLKCFIIFNVDGNEGDLCLLKHLCENAPFLKRLVINCSWDLSKYLEKQEEICQRLNQLRGDSASCSIEFIPYDDPLTWWKRSAW